MALQRVIAPHVLFFRVETRDVSNANALANPSSVQLTLYQPDGSAALTDQALTNSSTGVWTYSYPLAEGAAVGSWTGRVKITDSVGQSVYRAVSFDVVS